jgi:hypothetical protein
MFIGNNVSAPGYLEDRVTGNCSGEPNCLDDIFTAVQNCYGDLQDYFSVQISNVDIAANVLAHRALNNIKGKQFFDSAEFFMKKSANPMNRINPQSTTEQYNLPHYQ